MSENEETKGIDKTEELAATKEPARSWSTRTLAAATAAALIVGGGGAAALGAMSKGGESDGRGGYMRQGGQGPGGQMPDGQGQGGPGGAGMAPPQGTNPSTPADPATQDSSVDPDDESV